MWWYDMIAETIRKDYYMISSNHNMMDMSKRYDTEVLSNVE